MTLEHNPHLFLVGCPRSGTTLLQSLLAAHPEIASFPESHFFRKLAPFERRYWLLKQFGVASRRARPQLEKFLNEVGEGQLCSRLPRRAILMHQLTKAFIEVLDLLTKQQGKSIWLEKTPGHLHHIDLIQTLVPNAKFIHIIRNGADVVASLYEVTHEYPQLWGGQPLSIDRCIHEWMKDVKISHRYLHQLNHIVVSYEDVVENPQQALERLCHFIGINYDPMMLQEYQTVSRKLVLKHESWKKAVEGQIQAAGSKKFYTLFNEPQRRYILQKLSAVTITELDSGSVQTNI